MRFYFPFLIMIGISLSLSAQDILECNRYRIISISDSLDPGAGPCVYFQMTTDTNTYNTGYTDIFWVTDSLDTLTIYNQWGGWLPTTSGVLNDTLDYLLAFLPGHASFPNDFSGKLVLRNPECEIPFQYRDLQTSISKGHHLIDVYPNPTRDLLSIRHPTGLLPRSVKITDKQGRLISLSHAPPTQLDLHQLPPGIFHLEITWEHGEVSFHSISKI
ncbi:T9SS type A sorting domain-containing protein [Pontibacter sp. G13]|uniref:T9SS type A sorting domain-containing protein n=1 Tax=Pontibacter sp. G13 TaxID=3074898 RepID=UPI00288942D9|nr:T9SS type A sorting domain-containing protein [Pontibacter sp. G13]WNJ17157.1 T9SS type A sorting domain-containing protein [Pontibacter sp. G13]